MKPKRQLSNKRHYNDLPQFDDRMVKALQNKDKATKFLQVSIEEYLKDGHADAFLLALRHLAMAQGGITKLAEKTDLNRETLYRTLSTNGNPTLMTLGKILSALGFHLTVVAM